MDYEFDFDPVKNRELKKTRGISFEEVIFVILQDQYLDILEHPNKTKYSNQKIFVIDIDDYIYLVPFVINEKRIFLKTIFPSRKATRKYLERGDQDE